ncbi:bone morphogenetic protein receptor type-2 isoform X2 [Copidosoma floridanum]|uniref:bone morphogenetic protein receptor type-2 isoform X2 n=1 Tax=Copidosoma floridanum TaxID=29053 RepID=UPI0006C9A800|nr:bone morphogenetic protein receptor type-2 isoform X2 [Copidosoma floridanum]
MRATVKIALLVAIVCITDFALIQADQICAVSRTWNTSESEHADDSEIENSYNVNDRNQTGKHVKFEKCNQYCYAAWEESVTSNGTTIKFINMSLQAGCWSQEGHDCENTECIAKLYTNTKMHTKFCCCKHDYCNVNVTDYVDNKLILTSPATTEFSEQTDTDQMIMITVTILACILLVTFTVVILIYQAYKNNILLRLGKPVPYNDNYMDGNGLRTGTYTVDHLKLSTIVDQGRYGSVWQGSIGDEEVAVKIFPGHHQNYFLNERDLYCLPFMEHPSLLYYYGSDERVSMDGNVEYLLVFSYAPGGTLTEFLRCHTFDWMTFCKMSLSVVKGLAYLHTDVRKGDKFKPCIAHKNMCSGNILLKADGTCCICDLGIAVQILGSKYYSEDQHVETKSINDVGTLQYMAPEVLEGAVNLRDCESSLKQIDVYAMGIILWELVSRCTDIYVSGNEVPQYRQPFEKEIGLLPTFDQMLVLVSRNKARPLFEGSLVDKPGVRLIKETMEDCWDADAEARLTALCIEERLTELQSHRITMHFTDGSPMMNSHCGLVPSTTNSLYSDAPNRDGAHHVVQMSGNDCSDLLENLVTSSPSESNSHEHSSKNSNETNAASLSAHHPPQPQLQPYQGRNPCMERNLMMQSDSSEELGCQGNILVNKSYKHHTDKVPQPPSNSSETQSLVPHDYLGQQQQAQTQHHHHVISSQQLSLRSVTPIPYVQNVISECSGSGGSYNKLKQTNIQESCYTALPSNPPEGSPKRLLGFSGWASLKKILSSKKLMYQQQHPAYSKCEIEREDSKSNLLVNKNTAAANSHQPKIVETNVSILPGGKYVNGIVSEKTKNSDPSFMCDSASSRPSTLPLVSLRRSNSGHKRKSETTSLSQQESLDRFNEGTNCDPKDTSNRGEPAAPVRKTRAKNPSTNARLSLYDDRIMCSITNEERDKNGRSSDINSPSSSNSVPFSMDVTDDEQQNMTAKIDARNVTSF